MNNKLEIDMLGTCYITEVFVFYDFPQLFLCNTETGTNILMVCLDMNSEYTEYMALPLSESKLLEAYRNRVSLYQLYSKPEGLLWRIKQYHNVEVCEATIRNPEELTEVELPDEDAFLDYEFDGELENDETYIVNISELEKRDVIKLSLEPKESHVQEIDCSSLGDILIHFQDAVNSIADKGKSIKGKLSQDTKEENLINVVGFYAASFGVKFKSNKISDLFGETTASKAILELFELFDLKDNKIEIIKKLGEMSPKAGIKYRKFINSLRKAELSFKAEVATPKKDYINIAISKNDITKIYNILSEHSEIDDRTISLKGKLVGIDVKQNKFSFLNEEGESFTGKLDDSICDSEFVVPKDVSIRIREQVEVDDMTNCERYKYILLEVRESK